MPVAQLLCEGGNNSPDVRLLSKLLSGICEIKPLGGKYGMGAKIIARREAFGQNSVYGILDGARTYTSKSAGYLIKLVIIERLLNEQ